MVERDVALAKISLIERSIERIHSVIRRSDELEAIDVEELKVLNLQRASQSAIDLAAHVVSSEGWRLPESLGDNFTILAENGVITPELADNLRKMTGFRNIAVHTYESIDDMIVNEIIENRLQDLLGLASIIVQKFDLSR